MVQASADGPSNHGGRGQHEAQLNILFSAHPLLFRTAVLRHDLNCAASGHEMQPNALAIIKYLDYDAYGPLSTLEHNWRPPGQLQRRGDGPVIYRSCRRTSRFGVRLWRI